METLPSKDASSSCNADLKTKQSEELRVALKSRDPKRRFDVIQKLSKTKLICEADPPEDAEAGFNPKGAPAVKHGGCGNAQPKIRRTGLQLWAYGTRERVKMRKTQPQKRSAYSPRTLWNTFRTLTDETIATMGLNAKFAHPEWMIITALPVPPPPVRPSIRVDGTGQGLRGEDDLTYKLGDIIRANRQVRRAEIDGSPGHIGRGIRTLAIPCGHVHGQRYCWPTASLAKVWSTRQIHPRSPQGKRRSSSRKSDGQTCRFFRSYGHHWRPQLSLDEVGVPRSIARNLDIS